MAFPFGGEGFPEYLVMELHYDNPEMVPGKKYPKYKNSTYNYCSEPEQVPPRALYTYMYVLCCLYCMTGKHMFIIMTLTIPTVFIIATHLQLSRQLWLI